MLHSHCEVDIGYDGYAGDTASASDNSRDYGYYKDKKVRDPYSSFSTDPLQSMLRFLSDCFKQNSSVSATGTALFALFSVFALITMYYHRQFQWISSELQIDSFDQLVTSYQHLESHVLSKQVPIGRLQRLEKENLKLKTEKQEMKSFYETKTLNANRERKWEQNHLESKEKAWKSQVELLQRATVRESRRAVIDKFGEGPHHVEFTFILPDDESETERTFTVEMAPIDLMPHSIHLFLEQVAHKLWDDTWFYLNGPHVLQAGPMLDEEEYEHLDDEEWDNFDDRSVVLAPFKEKDLDSLAFPEYSEKFTHVEWTLGFTGRPGGPDWYINKRNNTIAHGPGGQNQQAIAEHADPCFAKVIDGFEQLNLIFKEPTLEEGDEWEYYLMEPTYIMKARIVDRPKPFLILNHPINGTQHDVEELGHAALHKRMHKLHIENQVEA